LRIVHWAILFVLINQSDLSGDSRLKPQNVQTVKLICRQIDDFKDGITLGEWRKKHAGDRIEFFQGRDIRSVHRWGYWCLSSSEQIVSDNKSVATRHAFFYPPRPPREYDLPGYLTSDKLLESLELGLIWISIRKAAGEGIALAQEISQSFKHRYSDAQSSATELFSSGLWNEAASWRSDQVTLASAYSNDEGEAIAAIFSSRSGLDRTWGGQAEPSYDNSKSLSRIQDLMRVSNMGGLPQTGIDDILKLNDDWQNSMGTDKPRLVPRLVVEALSHWITEAMQKPDRQKAASLLVGDLVLATVQHAFKISELGEGEEARLALSKLGAHFISHPIQASMVYSRSWLHDAQRLDAEGPIGELCFLILMETGFDPTGICAETSEKFMTVIKNGEEYLKQKRIIAHRQEIEIMVADAYRDIIAMAEGLADDENVDPNKYKGLTREALPKAIEHYRIGLQNARDSVQNRIAWSEAWRLIAGLPPVYIRYLCIID